MIASLPMYGPGQLREVYDRFWNLIRSELVANGQRAPERLSYDADEFSAWIDPDLVLSQTCGMPYRLWLHDRVDLVGTPDYGLDGCPLGHYRSVFVVRHADSRRTLPELREATFAYNQPFSQSGYAAAYEHLRPHGFFFNRRLRVGSHLESARAVSRGEADIACLDAVSWRLIIEHERLSDELRIIEWTDPTPGLPFITAGGNDVDAIFAAVEVAIEALADSDRQALGITGITRIPKADYLAVPNPDGSW